MKRVKILASLLAFPLNPSKNPQIFFPKPYKFTRKIETLIEIPQYPNKPTSEIVNSTNPSPEISPDFITVRETLSSYSNDPNKALDFFNWVETTCGFVHNTETYNSIIDTLGKSKKFDKCLEMIYIMKKKVHTLPNHTTFKIMFNRYVCAHFVREAIGLFDKLDEFDKKDEISFCNLIDALCEYKHVVEADEVLRRCRFPVVNQTKVHNMMLSGYAKMGWWSKCNDFWEKMDENDVRKDVVSYSIYMDVLCKSGKPHKAVQLYNEMRKRRMKLDVVAYNIVVLAVGLKDGVEFSVRKVKEMKELGCEPNVATYNTVVKLFCENGRLKEAYDMVSHMRKMGCGPDVVTYHCFFRSIVRPNELMGLFERMLKSDVKPTMDTYVMLLRKFGMWGFLRPVMFVWEKMKEVGCRPNAAAYNALIDALLQKGVVDLAKKYDEEMISKGLESKPRAKLGTKVDYDVEL